MQSINIIKVGGAIVEDKNRLNNLLDNFAKLQGPKVLVHGGGRRATKVAAALGIETKMIDGRRVTDKDMLEVVTMVYGGLVNKNVVASLQSRGVNAIGLTGADGNVIRSHKRPPVKVAGQEQTIDYGFVGDVDNVDGAFLKTLIDNGITPVMAPLTHDGMGNMLNTNADTIAAETAKALAKYYDVTLVYCFEKPGVLANPDDDSSVIDVINNESYKKFVADGTISGGMKPKIENSLAAVSAGVKKVVITKAEAILDSNKGTIIQSE